MAKKQPRPHPAKVDALWWEVLIAIGAGRVEWGAIHDASSDTLLHGVCDGTGRVVVNPSVEIVDTVVHELLHRLRPMWSEATVRRRTAILLRGLTQTDHDRLYHLIEAGMHRRRTPKFVTLPASRGAHGARRTTNRSRQPRRRPRRRA